MLKIYIRAWMSIVILAILVLQTGVVAAKPLALSTGACAKVINANKAGGLAVRNEPGTKGVLLKRIADGTLVKITSGPVSKDGYTWWKHDQGGWSAGGYLQSTTCPLPPTSGCNLECMLNKDIRLTNSTTVKARALSGSLPAYGMDSVYGKPGQLPLSAPVTSNTSMRNADLYRAVIHQFAVGNNQRYTPTSNYTYCNTFAGDVMRAMGAPLPTKSELFGKNDKATVGAADLYKWFTSGKSGWTSIDPNKPEDLKRLIAHVNAGKPAIATDAGHIAVVRPGQSSSITKLADLRMAQAGARNINNESLGNLGFGKTFKPVFFIKD